MRNLGLAIGSMLFLAGLAAPAAAEPSSALAPADAEPAQPAADQAQSAPSGPAPFSVDAVDDRALGTVAGREDTTQIAQSELVASVSSNSVGDNAVTGEARIDGNAFQNLTGMSILNINTGNNVAINAAMTVNISIQSGP